MGLLFNNKLFVVYPFIIFYNMLLFCIVNAISSSQGLNFWAMILHFLLIYAIKRIYGYVNTLAILNRDTICFRGKNI